ncbi:LysR family transcriptional regulator [Schlegelella sp. S2-27]|uniref:LysR family transcriptional regulator n=1 Tax=Caldimonas mangrovi TaxID=2944811 RepID=A0ABT0YNZ9_9BURK|nr:LysR family transcriptional regulator [Caldimonas mangrovi]
MRFDLFSLKLFVDVVDAHTIAGAAKNNHIALSAASRRMVELERSFGSRLLDRKPHGVLPTDAGRFLYGRLTQTLADLRRLSVEMSRFAQGAQGVVRLAADAAALAGALPQRLSVFGVRHPEVSVELIECASEDALRAVVRGEADVCVAGWMAERNPDLVYTPYADTEFVAVAPFDHPSALRGHRLSMAQLSACERVAVEASGAEQWLAHGAKVKVASYASACRLVAARCGVALMPRECAVQHAVPLGLKVIELDAGLGAVQLELCSRGFDSTPVAARCLIEHLRPPHEPALLPGPVAKRPAGARAHAG